MQGTDSQTRILAATESLGDLRSRSLKASLDLQDTRTYAAAVRVLMDAVGPADRARIAATVPARKASIGTGDLDDLMVLCAELIDRDQINAPPATRAWKAGLEWHAPEDPNLTFAETYNLTAQMVQADNQHRQYVAAKAESEAWVEQWLQHGRRRLQAIRQAVSTGVIPGLDR